ncbi:MAG: hypothetical protein AAFY67_06735 [Cyanobacteria bacterium J06642_9]
MVFTINPADAQAIQEDEAQLVAAILQATRGLTVNMSPLTNPQAAETLRIQMGRRLVYGQMASGAFRNELNAGSMRLILDAVQRPVTPGASLEAYQGKVPAIEIRNGEDILFREERDGTVTVNQIQFQLDQPALSPLKLAPESQNGRAAIASEAPTTIQAIEDADWKADDIAQIASHLLNPFGADQPIYKSVALQGYTIDQDGNQLTVAREGQFIVVAENDAIVENNITQQDWQCFQRIQRGLLVQQPVPQPAAELNGKQDGQRATVLTLQDSRADKDVPPAIAVLQNQLAKLPEGPTKTLLQTTAQVWQKQLQPGLQSGLKQGMDWLASRSQAFRQDSAARAALDLFNRGYERTGEKAYAVEGFRLSLQGLNLYTLSDSKGTLLRFQAFQSPIPGIRRQTLKILDDNGAAQPSRLTPAVVGSLRELQRNPHAMPRGNLDQEAVYAAKTNKVEKTVQTFLTTQVRANVWDREGGRYRFELGDGETLRIIDKQGDRGLVYQRHKGEVYSRLGAADFAHFDQLANRLQRLNQPVAKVSKSHGLKIS